LSSCTGQLGTLPLEDDGSCGHLSLNKNCPKYCCENAASIDDLTLKYSCPKLALIERPVLMDVSEE